MPEQREHDATSKGEQQNYQQLISLGVGLTALTTANIGYSTTGSLLYLLYQGCAVSIILLTLWGNTGE